MKDDKNKSKEIHSTLHITRTTEQIKSNQHPPNNQCHTLQKETVIIRT